MKIVFRDKRFSQLELHLNSTLCLFDIGGYVDRYLPLDIDPDIAYQRAGF